MAEIQNVKITNVETLEIRVSSGRKKYFFSDVSDMLKGKKIVDIVSVEGSGAIDEKSPTGNIIHPIQGAYLTLVVDQKEKIKDYPLYLLSPRTTAVRPSFNDLKPEWTKSFVTFNDVTDGSSLLLSVMFND